MKYKKSLVALFFGFALAGTAFYFAKRGDADGKPVPADAALRVDVKRQDLVVEVVDTGKVQPKERIEVKSKVAGQVITVLVEEGRRVKKGEVLLQLDPIDFERDVARAEAEVAQARNSVKLAELDLDRKLRGEREGAVARIDVEYALNAVETKKISVRSAQIAVATARDRLRYTQIVAPIDGTVLELGIKAGEVVTPGVQQTFEGRPLLTIGDLTTLIVRSELNQIDIAKIELDQVVTLSFDALPRRRFEARVTKSAPSAIKPKGKEVEAFPVEATLIEADPAIRPGMTADVRFQIDRRPNVFAVPIEAVVKEEEKAFVTKIVLAKGKEQTERAEVRLGVRNDRQLEVVDGLAEGEKLLIDPRSSKENEVEL